MAKTVRVYFESKEKIDSSTTLRVNAERSRTIDFKKISGFVKDNFGFAAKVKKLKESVIKTKGLVYDPVNTQRLFEKINADKRGLSSRPGRADVCGCIDIIIADKLIAAYEDTDKRLHLRAAVFGYPSVISTSGIVEAPAKPKEYYLQKQKYSLLKVWGFKEEEVKQKFKDRFIDYRDPRLTEVLKGYIAQAIFFELTGNPFCENKSCRLFNAHWQEDLIRAQIKSGKFCKFHKAELKKIKRGKRNERKS